MAFNAQRNYSGLIILIVFLFSKKMLIYAGWCCFLKKMLQCVQMLTRSANPKLQRAVLSMLIPNSGRNTYTLIPNTELQAWKRSKPEEEDSICVIIRRKIVFVL